ncbi:MAG: carbamate kinase [Mesoaciditoga sp.]|uniref:carbamate kinase n=1 Tax=Athalassotoga sp. TaxID=2022597 RepID=UPI000CC85F3D|nr:MAG: carbamate kinase [Mesoaciditoga sp.]PMP79644.1 MAG: carbamate kinase [Mesoaciditoga sp.]HEU23592.1 carbamate kinase [Mesoaciditoga lauensis]
MKKSAVIAVGGNAIQGPKEPPTAEVMRKNLNVTAKYLVDMLDDLNIVITHGNGPQVGNLMVQQDRAKELIPPLPLDLNDAYTQGMLGYLIVESMENQLLVHKKHRQCAAIVTQVVVDPEDKAFQNPTKPVGPFYDVKEAERLAREKGWKMKEDAGRGYRRVVPSPEPLDIIEKDLIKDLMEKGVLTVAVGGGGVPVLREKDGSLHGVEAVIDKDRASSLLARILNVDIFMILTGVDEVYLNYGKPDQKILKELKVSDAKKYLAQNQFPSGSMGPKIEAAISFVEATGRQCIITSLEKSSEAMKGTAGTFVIPD